MPYWSVQIKDILTEAGLFDIVSGVAPRPALQTDKGDNSVAVNSWDAKDKRALANIRTRVSSTMISYVINAMTSKQAWDSLKAVFDVQGPVAVILKRRRFFWYAIPEGADIEEHVHALRTCSEKLSLLQDPISDRDFTLVLLTALPESWDSFVATIDVNTTKSVDLTGRILQEDARRQSQSGTHAFPAFQRHPPGNGPTGPPGQTPHCFDRSTVTCHRCGKRDTSPLNVAAVLVESTRRNLVTSPTPPKSPTILIPSLANPLILINPTPSHSSHFSRNILPRKSLNCSKPTSG